MNAVECIKTRRSVRKFTDEMVSVDTVREIVELASYAPSWKNTQVIRYTLVEDPEIIAKIAAEGVMDFPLNQKTVSRAKQLMIVTKKDGICGYEKSGEFKRVQRHRKMRQGKGFETVECYTGLDKIRLPENCTVLLECMSNLVANEMFQEEGAHENTVEAVLKGVRHIREQAGNLVIVTNEIFSEAADYQGETELYQEYLGQINQKIAEIADQVVEVVYGIPVYHKNKLLSGEG